MNILLTRVYKDIASVKTTKEITIYTAWKQNQYTIKIVVVLNDAKQNFQVNVRNEKYDLNDQQKKLLFCVDTIKYVNDVYKISG